MGYSFPPELAEKVRQRMEAGRYQSEDDLISDALQAYDAMGEWLAQWKDDVEARIEEAGPDDAKPLDVDALMARVRARLAVKNAS